MVEVAPKAMRVANIMAAPGRRCSLGQPDELNRPPNRHRLGKSVKRKHWGKGMAPFESCWHGYAPFRKRRQSERGSGHQAQASKYAQNAGNEEEDTVGAAAFIRSFCSRHKQFQSSTKNTGMKACTYLTGKALVHSDTVKA
jgi:hypothetical protein